MAVIDFWGRLAIYRNDASCSCLSVLFCGIKEKPSPAANSLLYPYWNCRINRTTRRHALKPFKHHSHCHHNSLLPIVCLTTSICKRQNFVTEFMYEVYYNQIRLPNGWTDKDSAWFARTPCSCWQRHKTTLGQSYISQLTFDGFIKIPYVCVSFV